MTTLTEHAAARWKDVQLLDGRRISIDLCGRTSIFSDVSTLAVDFSWFRPHVAWHESLRRILVGLLSTHSAIYASRCTDYAGRFADSLPSRHSESLRLSDLKAWPEKLGLSGWPFMQAVLGHWTRSGLPGLESKIANFLQSPEKWEEKENGWYFALVANDPERGAFTEQELKSIQAGVNSGYETGVLSLYDWALVWFLIGTGVRPIQIVRMNVGDVLVTDGPEGKEVTLSIPLAKGENVVVKDRWKRKAPTVLVEVLLRYMADRHPHSRSDAPLFADQSRKIASRITSIFNRVATYSKRLDGPIPVFPYRFRYTLGTRALALGASDHEVARLLTHRTTHCIQYYRAAMPMLQKPIRDALGPEMSFIAQAFQGRLINNLDEATRRGEASALIRDFAHLMGQSIGACGTRAECHQDAPRACLTCRKFEPFRQAPWERLLEILMEDMEAETEDRIKLITLEQITAVRGIMAEVAGGAA